MLVPFVMAMKPNHSCRARLPGCQVYALELDPYLRDFAAPQFEASGLQDRIEVLVGPAADSIKQLASRGINFDIAFLVLTHLCASNST